ncbi:MAG: tetratricopeptide repeat protein [Pseudomonadota bacterium]|nr:tetratricopeptide repeat protein [Pseudomonadota bacterium]
MADDIKIHFSEDEDLEKAKAWWKSNGSSIVWGIAIGLTAVVGFNFWQKYTQGKAEGASALFNQVLQQDASGGDETLPQLAQEVMDDYRSTPYAAKAALIQAKAKLEAGDQSGAEEALRWALDKSGDPATRHAARLRLAALQLDGGKTDEALKLLSVKDQGGFGSHYAELEGDAHLARGDRAQAGQAYQRALETLTPGSPYGRILQHKLDNVGAAETGAQ